MSSRKLRNGNKNIEMNGNRLKNTSKYLKRWVSSEDTGQNHSYLVLNTNTRFLAQQPVLSELKFDLPKIPLFTQVENEPDNIRRKIIEEIEKKTDRTLILYYSNPQHPAGSLNYQDVTLIHELLRILDYPEKIDLVIHSGGGIIEATEKLVKLVWSKVDSFRVIIMEFAKSAATSLSLASNQILMSFMAELGPIDPLIQIGIDPQTKQPDFRPAWSYIHALDILETELKEKNRDPRIVGQLLTVMDPIKLDIAKKAIDYSKTLAKEWLVNYMKIKKEDAEKISEELCDAGKLLSHGRVISYEEARDLGLNVEKIDTDHELWPLLYHLHIRALQVIRPPVIKLYECRSQTIRGHT
ncbi:hypothetical protein DRP05_14810 [Archaeoglobales archaeon]|nr:MAG: hypothetical protein DRP05_14810 [Archaeoglobales archaeon]